MVGIILLITKLYACCFVSGACCQNRDIADRPDPLSRVRTIPQTLSARPKVVQSMELDTFERSARYAQLDGGKRNTLVIETQDAISQTYSFPQKYAVIDL